MRVPPGSASRGSSRRRESRSAIRSPAPSTARIDLPHGFEYSLAEMGSGTTKATGDIKLDFEASYGQFAQIHLSPSGPVRAQAA